MDAQIVTLLFTYFVYVILAQKIVRSAIKYRELHDISIAFYISAICWIYFVFIYTVALFGYFSGVNTFVTIENLREYIRVLALPLLTSTTYLIMRVFK